MIETRLRSTYFVLILLIGFYCLDFFYRITPGLVVHQLISQYHTNPLGIGLFASSFYLGYTVFQIPSGILLDKISIKISITAAIFICTLSFFVFIFAHSFGLGWLARFFTGIASAFSFISVLYVARMYLPKKYFSIISGITIAVGTLVSSFIQVITAFFIHHYNWHLILSIFALAGIVIALILAHPKFSLPSSPTTDDTSDCQKNTIGTIFLQIKTLLLKPGIWINGIMGGLFYLPTSLLAAAWGISFFTKAYQIDSTSASTLILMLFIGWAIGSPLVGYLNQYVKHHKYISVLFALLAALISYVVLYHAAFLHDAIYITMLLFGLFSSAQVSIWKNFAGLCPKEMTGTGIALTNMLVLGTAVIFHAVVGSLIEHAYAAAKIFTPQVYLHGLVLIPFFFLASYSLALVK